MGRRFLKALGVRRCSTVGFGDGSIAAVVEFRMLHCEPVRRVDVWIRCGN